ncbi:MAG: CDP-diacylglycerol--glycerol-3-phosphate 3-phosphatidyltransferase [Candidatus Marinimicrobia bacterium]|nr:CDP-diacylglycerol--glycerol-3-phosphate 3-phosphatidyltransferase [Candidatus Neomarinimicrobiota bacterium]
MTIPNMLTIFRILLTPVFILLLFHGDPMAKFWALVVFIVASITDAYDGYYARKYDQVTEQGKFLDPLADKILVSSAFISFAVIGLVDYWMVALIIFRDLFITGLRMLMNRKGFEMVTSKIAKMKTGTQLSIIVFILIYIGFKPLALQWLTPAIHFVTEFQLIYALSLLATAFTVFTGFDYLYSNRSLIQNFFKEQND